MLFIVLLIAIWAAQVLRVNILLSLLWRSRGTADKNPEMLVLLLGGAGTAMAVRVATEGVLGESTSNDGSAPSKQKRAWSAFCKVPLGLSMSLCVPGSSTQVGEAGRSRQ